MTESEFRTLDPLADALDEACARWFASPALAALKDALRKAVASLPPTYSVSIDVELRVFDTEREQALNLLTTGLNTDHGGEPYRISGDSSVHRYVAGGEICEVPHDRCPQCWGVGTTSTNARVARSAGFRWGVTFACSWTATSARTAIVAASHPTT
jgi:hypothetical protein